MKFDKDFNPGQGNTYTEINFGPNSQYLPNVTELTINNGVLEEKGKLEKPESNIDLDMVKAEICKFVSKITPKLKPKWQNCWQHFWKGLLNLDIIEQQINDITKQQGTTFNRKLVCNVIRYLDQKGFYEKDFNASEMARMLEGDDQHSIRTHGLNTCPDDNVCKRIDRYIEEFNL